MNAMTWIPTGAAWACAAPAKRLSVSVPLLGHPLSMSSLDSVSQRATAFMWQPKALGEVQAWEKPGLIMKDSEDLHLSLTPGVQGYFGQKPCIFDSCIASRGCKACVPVHCI